jgi:hypothetical protein
MFDSTTLPQSAVVFVPLDQLATKIDEIVHKAIREKQQEDLQAQFLSPKETCKLFNPSISLVTLASWTDKGLLKKYSISGRTYYKYSEVIESLKTLKKYAHHS